ncbi:ATP-binding protein [Cylindrospermum sp. FACHB-282]|uniref:ATP-binding protein n=1 Tax=Cylindrospermum sp. FACHB-282 TaxID=2692794 RepID=UPI001682B0C7|nr:ATP-binding protein [Cylindrospermum sp. FACHB-282]MBD2386162.1 amino acid permease [Cylindrospermum sp. FACHB-282]
MNGNTSEHRHFSLSERRNQQPLRLERTLSALETGGFSLSGLLLWLGVAPSIHIALGTQAMLVWLPAAIVSMLLNLQVYRLGIHYPDTAGGTPNYITKLLKDYPYLATYGAIGYLMGWVSVPPINAIILTNLIKIQLASLNIACPETLLKIGFTLIPFILAFSSIRASSILHLFFVLPAIGFLVVFCVQGLGWLAYSPASPGFFPPLEMFNPTSLHFVDWAKWFFIAIYGTYAGESASSFIADSKKPGETLRFLKLTASLIPIVYLGGSWVMMRLNTGLQLGDDTFSNLLAAAMPFWGESASVLVTFLIVCGAFLSSATAVSNSPRIFYQLAIDGYLSPVFAVLSHRGVLVPSLVFTLLLSLICLAWGDVSRIVMVAGTSYVVAMMAIHLGMWLRRRHPEALAPWWSLGIFLMEAVVLVVGGWAWGWQDWTVGMLLPIVIIFVDVAIRRLPWAPFHPNWWIERDRIQAHNPKKDFVATQVVVLLLLVCTAVTVTWVVKGILDETLSRASKDLFVVLLIAIAFVSVAVACWTSLPQVAAIDEARQKAENLFITALDTVLDTILVVDEDGVINQANPAAELLLGINKYTLLGQRLNNFLPGLPENPATWQNRSEQTLEWRQSLRTIEATISQHRQQFLKQYIVILRDVTERKQAEVQLQQALRNQEELAVTATAQAQQLKVALQNLKITQSQLIQTEKMSSLGQIVAGVAHEINNPVSFIYGNLSHVDHYTQDLLTLVNLYQQNYPQTNREIQDWIENIQLNFLIEDLPKTLSSIKVGAVRIREIVLTLRNFSRLDEADMKPVDIHQGIDSTLLILNHRLQDKLHYPSIEVIKQYGKLPLIECYAGQLNQVFMNILSNAIDALEQQDQQRSKQERLKHKSVITISTQLNNQQWVTIKIKDNGSGMTEFVKSRLFDPFFTTKTVGKGTGLGLSISYQIVVNQHGGKIKCVSTLGQGAEFVIEIPIQQNQPTKINMV